jgi:chromosome segregation ATPase
MASVDISQKIAGISENVKFISFDEKKEIPSEEQVDRLLDALIESKKFITAKTERTRQLTEALESITWLTNPSEKDLQEINLLIGSARDLRRTLYLTCTRLDTFSTQKQVLTEEVNELKQALDDFTEVINDVESVFFSYQKINHLTILPGNFLIFNEIFLHCTF